MERCFVAPPGGGKGGLSNGWMDSVSKRVSCLSRAGHA